ncbi:hypothetical protein F2Q69_00004174 [Brassica cretica]|uniref:Uncharacterized protein n=1 Tax=Brassica cretica TaxID=69181 RepID=A0A8S9P4H9_BRACR|nr:hypothetical protein F2Q69_00004174 [Brassica cretica]
MPPPPNPNSLWPDRRSISLELIIRSVMLGESSKQRSKLKHADRQLSYQCGFYFCRDTHNEQIIVLLDPSQKNLMVEMAIGHFRPGPNHSGAFAGQPVGHRITNAYMGISTLQLLHGASVQFST